jgi:hypothetical protein
MRWTVLGLAVAVLYHLRLRLPLPCLAYLLQTPLKLSPNGSPKHDTADHHPPPSFTRHIVAVGDLHGDLLNAERVLRFSGVVNDVGEWSGDVDVFVQTGDIIDRSVRMVFFGYESGLMMWVVETIQ